MAGCLGIIIGVADLIAVTAALWRTACLILNIQRRGKLQDSRRPLKPHGS